MPDTKPPAAKNSLVTTRRTCPLCESKSRQEIDILCVAFKQPTEEFNGEIVDVETGVIGGDEAVQPATLLELEANVREMLEKLGDDGTEFTLADLVIHLEQHTLVREFSGIQMRSEGNYLIFGTEVYEKKDLKTYLSAGIEKGLEAMMTGKMKWTLNGWAGMIALLWRMQGTSGDDPFMQKLLQNTQAANLNPESPLGVGYSQHHETLAKSKPPVIEEIESVESEE